MAKISIIIPIYNTEKYVSQCIDSILDQSFNDFELILVDDGSTDSSYEICREYELRDNRIHLYSIQNSGPANARNYGINKAVGNYITFVDSDDVVTNDYLKKMIDAIEENNADICVSNIVRLNDEEISKKLKCCIANDVRIYTDNQSAIFDFLRMNNNKIRSSVAKLLKSTIARNHLFPTDRKWSEDTAVVYKWYYDADRIIDLNDNIYIYI